MDSKYLKLDTVEGLKEAFNHVNFIELKNGLLFQSLEFWNSSTDETVYFDSEEDVITAFKDELANYSFELDYKGGRGASSEKLGGGFNHAREQGGDDNGKVLHPAEFNTQGRFVTQEEAVRMFEEKYGGADKEYGISVDDNGYVHRHIAGSKSSVAIHAAGENHMIIHNHPSGGAFSDSDMLVMAQDKRAKGIVATSVKNGKKNRYTLTKKKNFDAAGFAKAVKQARWPVGMSYDEGADWWLRRNAPKYGVEYSHRT